MTTLFGFCPHCSWRRGADVVGLVGCALGVLSLMSFAAVADETVVVCEPDHELKVKLTENENVELEWTIKYVRGERRVAPSEKLVFELELPEGQNIKIVKIRFVDKADQPISCRDMKKERRGGVAPIAKTTCDELQLEEESLQVELDLIRHHPDKKLGMFGKSIKLLVSDKFDDKVCGISDDFKLKEVINQ